MLKRVCVGFDGSDNAYLAFDFAIDLCKMCPSAALEVHVIAVAMPPEVPNVDYDAIMSAPEWIITKDFSAAFEERTRVVAQEVVAPNE